MFFNKYDDVVGKESLFFVCSAIVSSHHEKCFAVCCSFICEQFNYTFQLNCVYFSLKYQYLALVIFRMGMAREPLSLTHRKLAKLSQFALELISFGISGQTDASIRNALMLDLNDISPMDHI